MLFGALATSHLDVHLHTLLGDPVMHACLLTVGRFTVCIDGLVNATQQLERLFVEALFVIQCSGFDTTLHTLLCLSLGGIVVKGANIQRACFRNILRGIYGLGLFLKFTFLLCINSAAANQTEKDNK